MNIAFFLIPKSRVAFLYDDCTVRQGLEKLRYHGYTAIPVISRDNKYVGSVSQGDFLWYLADGKRPLKKAELTEVEDIPLSVVMNREKNLPVGITSSIEDLVTSSINQNFVPVVDDLNNFIGIVTRSDILKYYYSGTNNINIGPAFIQITSEM